MVGLEGCRWASQAWGWTSETCRESISGQNWAPHYHQPQHSGYSRMLLFPSWQPWKVKSTHQEEMLRLRRPVSTLRYSPTALNLGLRCSWVFFLTCCALARRLTGQPAAACCSVGGWGGAAPSPWPCSRSTPGCRGRRECEQEGVNSHFCRHVIRGIVFTEILYSSPPPPQHAPTACVLPAPTPRA